VSETQKNRELIKWYIENGVNKNNLDNILSLFADDGFDHSAPPGMPQGKEGVRMLFSMFFTGFPGIQAQIEDVLAEGDLIVFRATVRGKHTGVFMGIPPTGREIEARVIDVIRIENGKIKERWGGFDTFGMAQQLGIVPPLGGA
jgi:steroid delta-isomerase-like uncharacterized protein